MTFRQASRAMGHCSHRSRHRSRPHLPPRRYRYRYRMVPQKATGLFPCPDVLPRSVRQRRTSAAGAALRNAFGTSSPSNLGGSATHAILSADSDSVAPQDTSSGPVAVTTDDRVIQVPEIRAVAPSTEDGETPVTDSGPGAASTPLGETVQSNETGDNPDYSTADLLPAMFRISDFIRTRTKA